MDALVYTAPVHVELRDLPEPEAGPHDVVIRTSACGICGSDIHGFQGKSRIRIPPMVMGHEFGGRITSLGESVEGIEIGQRVVAQPVVGCGHCPYCRNGRANICPRRELIGGHRQGAFADFVKVPARQVYPVSDSLSDVAGTLVEPLANGVHMLGLGGGVLDRSVIVLGAGTLGLLTVALARLGGARHVIVTDVDAHRLEVARRLGADEALDAREEGLTERISQRTGGGADLVIDAAGYTTSRRQAIAAVAAGGTVVLLGLSDPESELPILDIINREIALRGSYASTDDDFRHAIAILEAGKIDTDSWIEPGRLEKGQEYFEALASHESELIKVVFEI